MPDDLTVYSQEELDRVLSDPSTLDPEQTIVLARRDPNAIQVERYSVGDGVPNPVRVDEGTMVTALAPLNEVTVNGGFLVSPNAVQRNVSVEGGRATLPRGSKARAIDGAVHIHGGSVVNKDTEITLRGKSDAITDSGKVFAFDESHVEATGTADVRAHDKSRVDAFGSATFRADDDVTVRAHEGASGHAHGRSEVMCNASRVQLTWASPDAKVNAYMGMELRVSDEVPEDRVNDALRNATHVKVDRIDPIEAKLQDALDIARVSGGNAFHQDMPDTAALNGDVRELLDGLPEGDPRAEKIKEEYARAYREQADKAPDTSPDSSLTDDADESRHLVYEDSAGNLHYQPVSDVPVAGTLIDTETGDDMEMVGWATEDGGELRDDDMELVYRDNDGNVHRQSWKDIDEMGGLIDENGDDMELVGSSTDSGGEQGSGGTQTCDECGDPFETHADGTTHHVDRIPGGGAALDRDHVPYARESCCAGCDCGYGCAPGCEVGPLCPKHGTSPVTEKVAALPDGTLVKVGHKGGQPSTVQTFDQDRRRWGRSMTVTAGQGKDIIDTLFTTPPEARKVPVAVAAEYGQATGVCVMCGRALSSESSLRAGYGPGCRGKMR